jgi:Tfp pilus assembly protein PilE
MSFRGDENDDTILEFLTTVVILCILAAIVAAGWAAFKGVF